MKKSNQGVIINISSNSFLLGLKDYPVYATSKAGILGMTKALANELGEYNIRVNTLVLGWVMTKKQIDNWVNKESLTQCLKEQCLKTTIKPDDIIGPCLFLASNLSNMITSQMLIVDGGRT